MERVTPSCLAAAPVTAWVDLEAGRVRVVATLTRTVDDRVVIGPPKSGRVRRQIAVASVVVESLRRHRARQASERLAVGEAWQDEDFVFSNEIGRMLRPARARLFLRRVLSREGLPEIRFHDLRHTCATLLQSSRVNPKIVSEMLRHSSVSITLDTYSHVLPDMQEDATAVMPVALGW